MRDGAGEAAWHRWLALIGDMPNGAAREEPFRRLVSAAISNLLVARSQTHGEPLVHWVKVRVDPRSTGVFSIEQNIVRSNL